MRVRVAATVIAVLIVSGCGSAVHTKTVARTFVAPPLQAFQVGRASNDIFSIFPAKPGTKHCVIPGGGMRTAPLRGTCQTVVYPGHVKHGPRFIVVFTER